MIKSNASQLKHFLDHVSDLPKEMVDYINAIIELKLLQGESIEKVDCNFEQEIPILGKVKLSGLQVSQENPCDAKKLFKSTGIDVRFEKVTQPQTYFFPNTITRIYIGKKGTGIVASYDVFNQQWYQCTSHGNYGKNYACGGTWSAKKVSADDVFISDLLSQIYNYKG